MFTRTVLSAALVAVALVGCSSRQAPPTITPATSRCGVFKTGSNVRVVVSPGNDTVCQDVAKSLSRDGSFWTVRNQPVDNGELALVCAMQKDGYLAYVEDTGGQIYGRGLCSGFVTVGWTEDTAVEDQVAAQASSAAQAQAAASATAAAANQLAQNKAAAADQLVKDEAAVAALVASIQTDIQPLAKDLSGMDSDVNKENDDLTALKKDAAKGPGTMCDTVQAVAYDATQTVSYDAHQTVGYDAVQNVGYHLSALRQEVSALPDAVHRVTGEGGPPTNGADSAAALASSAITNAITRANANIDQANSMAFTGTQIAKQLATGDCSGNEPSSYQPVPHIS